MQPEAVRKGSLPEHHYKKIMTILPYIQEYLTAKTSPEYNAERIQSARRDLLKADPGARVLCNSIQSLTKLSMKKPETADVTLAVPEHAQHLLKSNIEGRSADMELINTIGKRLHRAGGVAWLWLAFLCTPWFDTRDRTAVFMAWNGIDNDFSI